MKCARCVSSNEQKGADRSGKEKVDPQAQWAGSENVRATQAAHNGLRCPLVDRLRIKAIV
jgi:hypothetical protein